MVRVKVTRNYQVTIPAEVRDEAGIKIGDYLEVSVDGDRIVLRKVPVGRLRLRTGSKLAPEEIEAIIIRGLAGEVV